MANLSDVAKKAGVSVATVSRFLNGSLSLPEARAQQIRDAVAELRYVPNPHARRLSRGRSDAVGLVVPDIAGPFFSHLVAAIEEEADRLDLGLVLHATLNRPAREMRYLDGLRMRHLDGMIFVTNRAADDTLLDAVSSCRNLVLLDEDVPGARVPKVFCDNEAGGRMAGAHLAAMGHRSVLFVGGIEEMISGRRRLRGFEQAMAEGSDGPVRIDRVRGTYTPETGREAGRRFLRMDPRPTAIFASSDEILIGLIEVLRDALVSIPGDVSILGFDDVGPLHLFSPPVTAIRQPVRDLGRSALGMLLETLKDDTGETASTEKLLPVTLVERASVAPPAGNAKRRSTGRT
ncbi:LacI family DNA-binding transcriptional regulator [Palleronia sp. LCG004]|uniref:LacI family DNA-binding transcriptional regulator n=1 Tax=Palleronia sp. LCG004 TaxID=3079304 RepID=UPI002943BCB2|nr:LacI family DNA-binding transcriptional regulator [Palleronia sp. LCG004]WOI57788.1 LacI family DNA-binding transcriptional regulator [Palleronia sp. LCG004]